MIHGRLQTKMESGCPHPEKRAWRERMGKERAELFACPERHAGLAEQLQRRLLDSDVWKESDCVLLYASLPDEVDTWLLLEDAWRTGKRVFLPRCLPGRRGDMEMLACSCREELVPSSLGILEPPAGAEAFTRGDGSESAPGSEVAPDSEGAAGLSDGGDTPAEFGDCGSSDTLIVVPGLAFDREGYRIGYGGGYYDRLLGRGGLRSVGLVFFDHVFDRLPRDAWDVAVNGLCTEENLLWI